MRSRGRLFQLPAGSQSYSNKDDKTAELHIKLFRVQRVEGSILQVGICQKSVNDKENGRAECAEVHCLPTASADLETKVRCNNDEGDTVQCERANCVDQRLLRSVKRKKNVDQAKMRRFGKENQERM